MKKTQAGIMLVLAVACGCKVGPDYQRPEMAMPQRYSSTQPTTTPATQPAGTAELKQWWDRFGDRELSSLIARATDANLDLKLAQSRLREARAFRGVAASAGQPQVDAGGAYSRSRQSKTIADGSQFGPTETDLYTAGFDSRWELDVFGGDKRAVEAADADLAASADNVLDVLITVQAEVARNYVDLRSNEVRLRVAKDNLAIQNSFLELTDGKYRAGLVTEVEVLRAQAQVETTRSQIPLLEAEIGNSRHRLAVLVGQMPAELDSELALPVDTKFAQFDIPAGQPGELLQRRPDIRRAEREVAAATARIGVAKADLYPKFSILGSLGTQSGKFTNWWQSDSTFWSIGPQIRWSILNGGRVRSDIEIRNARQEQAVLRYEQTILLSVEEVENGLVSYAHEQRRCESLKVAVEANRKAVAIANDRYRGGLTDFSTVLDAQRALAIDEDLLVQSNRNVATYAISIYKALGGGWN